MRLLFLCCPLLLSLEVSAAPGAVAWLPLEGDDVAAAGVARVDSKIKDELRRLPGLSLTLLPPEVAARCEGRAAACLEGLGAQAGVARLASGRLSPRGEGYALALYVVDVGSGEGAAEASADLPADATAQSSAVRAAVTSLLAPERHVGSLLVWVSEPGARVLVDGLEVGASPLEGPLTGLRPGPRALEVHLAGHRSVSRLVHIAFEELTTEAVTLVEGEGVSDGSTAAAPAAAPAPTLLHATGGGLLAGGALCLGTAGLVAGLAYVPGVLPAGTTLHEARERKDQLVKMGAAVGALTFSAGLFASASLGFFLAASLE